MKCAFNVLAQLPNSQVNLQLHKMVKDTKTKTWSVTPDKDVVFVVKQLDTSKKEKPCDQNAGSYVKLASLHDSTKVVYYMRWRFLSRAVLATDSTPLTMCIVASEQPIGGAPCEPAVLALLGDVPSNGLLRQQPELSGATSNRLLGRPPLTRYLFFCSAFKFFLGAREGCKGSALVGIGVGGVAAPQWGRGRVVRWGARGGTWHRRCRARTNLLLPGLLSRFSRLLL